MQGNWIKIYTSNQLYKSEMVKQILMDNDIEAVIMNKKDTSYTFGEVEVHIHQSDFNNALEIIIQSDL